MKSIALLAAVVAQPGLPTWAFTALCIVALGLVLCLILLHVSSMIRAEEATRDGELDELGGSHEHTPVDGHPSPDPRRTTRR